MDTINKLKKILDNNLYRRTNKDEVIQSFKRLTIKVSNLVEDFFINFEGPFWEETIGMTFLDIIEDDVNIEYVTNECREYHLFPNHYLVLTDMVANEVIVLNTLNDKVYRVNFEGGDEDLINNCLDAKWNSFEDFLVTYFKI